MHKKEVAYQQHAISYKRILIQINWQANLKEPIKFCLETLVYDNTFIVLLTIQTFCSDKWIQIGPLRSICKRVDVFFTTVISICLLH